VRWKEAYQGFGRRYWIDLIEQTGANVSQMARLSGVRRNDVYRELRKFAVTLPERIVHRGNWEDLLDVSPEPTHEL
jgi:DNA-binding NtrC family response regulator